MAVINDYSKSKDQLVFVDYDDNKVTSNATDSDVKRIVRHIEVLNKSLAESDVNLDPGKVSNIDFSDRLNRLLNRVNNLFCRGDYSSALELGYYIDDKYMNLLSDEQKAQSYTITCSSRILNGLRKEPIYIQTIMDEYREFGFSDKDVIDVVENSLNKLLHDYTLCRQKLDELNKEELEVEDKSLKYLTGESEELFVVKRKLQENLKVIRAMLKNSHTLVKDLLIHKADEDVIQNITSYLIESNLKRELKQMIDSLSASQRTEFLGLLSDEQAEQLIDVYIPFTSKNLHGFSDKSLQSKADKLFFTDRASKVFRLTDYVKSINSETLRQSENEAGSYSFAFKFIRYLTDDKEKKAFKLFEKRTQEEQTILVDAFKAVAEGYVGSSSLFKERTCSNLSSIFIKLESKGLITTDRLNDFMKLTMPALPLGYISTLLESDNMNLSLMSALELLAAAKREINGIEPTEEEDFIDASLIDLSLYKLIDNEPLLQSIIAKYKSLFSESDLEDMADELYTLVNGHNTSSYLLEVYKQIGCLPSSEEKLHLLIQATIVDSDLVLFYKIIDEMKAQAPCLISKKAIEIYTKISLGSTDRSMISGLGLPSSDSQLDLFSFYLEDQIKFERYKQSIKESKSRELLLESTSEFEEGELLSYIHNLSAHIVGLNGIVDREMRKGKSALKDAGLIEINKVLSERIQEASIAFKVIGVLKNNDERFILCNNLVPLLDAHDRSLLNEGIKNGFEFFSETRIPRVIAVYLQEYIDNKALRNLAKSVGKKINNRASNLSDFFVDYSKILQKKDADLENETSFVENILEVNEFTISREKASGILLKSLVMGWSNKDDLDYIIKEENSIEEIVYLTMDLIESLESYASTKSIHKIRSFNLNLKSQINNYYQTLYNSLDSESQTQLCEALYDHGHPEPLFHLLSAIKRHTPRQEELLYNCTLCIWADGLNIGLSEVHPFGLGKSVKLSYIEDRLAKFEKNNTIATPRIDDLSEDSPFHFAQVCRSIHHNPEIITNVNVLAYLINTAQKQGQFNLVFEAYKQIDAQEIHDMDILTTLLTFASGSQDKVWFDGLYLRTSKLLGESNYVSSKLSRDEVQTLLLQLSPEGYNPQFTAFQVGGEVTSLDAQLKRIQRRDNPEAEREYFQISSKVAESSKAKKELLLDEEDKKSIILAGSLKMLVDKVSAHEKEYKSREKAMVFLESLFGRLQRNKEKIINGYNNNLFPDSGDYELEELKMALNNPEELLDTLFSFEDDDQVDLGLEKFSKFEKELIKYMPGGSILNDLLKLKPNEMTSLYKSIFSNAMGNTALNRILQYFGSRLNIEGEKIDMFLTEMGVISHNSTEVSDITDGIEEVLKALKSLTFNVRYIKTVAQNYNKMKFCLDSVSSGKSIPNKQRLTLEEFGSFNKFNNMMQGVVYEFDSLLDFQSINTTPEINLLAFSKTLDVFKKSDIDLEELVPEGHFQEGDVLFENENKFARMNKRQAWNLQALFKGKSFFQCLNVLIKLFKELTNNVFGAQTAFTGKYMHASIMIRKKDKHLINAEIMGEFEQDGIRNNDLILSEHYRPNFIKLIDQKSEHLLKKIIEKENNEKQSPHLYVGSLFRRNLNRILESDGDNLKKLVNSEKRAVKSIFYNFPIIGYFLKQSSNDYDGYKILQQTDKKNRKMFCSEFVSEAFLLAMEMTNKDLRDKLKIYEKEDIGLKKILEGVDIDSEVDFLINPIPKGVLPKAINSTRLQSYLKPYFTRIAPPRILRELIQSKELAIE